MWTFGQRRRHVPAEAAAPERGGKEWRCERRFWEGVFMKIFPQRFTSHV
jgi:hypothetical protein